MIKVLTVMGTRPEAIKLAPVLAELRGLRSTFSSVVCITGQHRQMLEQVLRIFNIVSDHDLNIMKEKQTLFDITTASLLLIGDVIEKERPHIVLVQGDTTTAFAGSLAAYYSKVPIGHIEAGLRTLDKYQPFPEEVNRRLTAQLADLHFAPTPEARSNLLKSGIDMNQIFVTGNTVIDAVKMIIRRQSSVEERESWFRYFIEKHNVMFDTGRRIILVTAHRRESFGQGIENICNALHSVAQKFPEVDIVYPVHLNPQVQEPVNRILAGIANVRLLPPLDYEACLFLLSRSYIVLTDSGGIQEEAPSLGKPVLVMRSTTERPEGIQAGTARLIGTDRSSIVHAVTQLLTDEKLYQAMSRAHNPYGDGHAAVRIVDVLREQFH